MTSFTCHSSAFEELLVLIMYIFRLCLAQCSGGAESPGELLADLIYQLLAYITWKLMLCQVKL